MIKFVYIICSSTDICYIFHWDNNASVKDSKKDFVMGLYHGINVTKLMTFLVNFISLLQLSSFILIKINL